jgi:pimeloyl-ACP methyl ester carboxylesterase
MQKTILYKNHPVYYSVSGEGRAVVLIHGFAEDGNIWKYQVPDLEQYCKLIIPDLPGSGKSTGWEDLSMESLADSVRMILKEENINQAIVIGHSMGGYVTLAFAEKYPELLRSFGLFHSTAYADTEEKKATRRKSIEFIKTHGSYEFLKQSSPNTFSTASREKHPEKVNELIEDYKDFNPDAMISYYEAMIKRPDRTQVLKDFTKPILFIIGQHDNAIPLNDSLQQCHLPVFSYIYILKQSGHMGMWEEATESNHVLKEFLAQQ